MLNHEVLKYQSLNRLAESDGTVIFGGSDDVNIPLGELKQAFSLTENIYNRSFTGLTVKDATNLFHQCIAELCPDTLLLHIGEADVSDFDETAFETDYRELIKSITSQNKSCRVVIVSLKNYGHNATVEQMNHLLKKIADCEKCEFEDISAKREWNVKKSGEVTSFLYEIGFDTPLKVKRPLYNLVRILFCREV